MISRKSARFIAEAYVFAFQRIVLKAETFVGYDIDKRALYEFLYDNELDSTICNAIKDAHVRYDDQKLKKYIMQLHTGESSVCFTPDWDAEPESIGQEYLIDLAEAIIKNKQYFNDRELARSKIEELVKQLELDGFEFKNGKLLVSETELLDVDEEIGVIHNLYSDLCLENGETTFHYLSLTEEYYISGKWDDSISNSRKFLECILREVVTAHSLRQKGAKLDSDVYSNQKSIRSYLLKEGLLDAKEHETITSVYGLLSQTGGHPYMAGSEQARLLRHLSLTFSQFVMLRLRGALAKSI